MIPGLAQMGWRSGVAMSCDVGHKRGLDATLPWLWPAAAAPTGPLAWELPYASTEVLKRKKKRKKGKERGGEGGRATTEKVSPEQELRSTGRVVG